MLYDILPPTVFILSVGALVVVLSRIVARMNRSTLAADIQSVAASGATAKSRRTTSSVMHMLRPSQKSVQSAPTRRHLWQQYRASIAAGLGRAFGGLRRLPARSWISASGSALASGLQRVVRGMKSILQAIYERPEAVEGPEKEGDLVIEKLGEEAPRDTTPSSVVQDAVTVTHHAVPDVKPKVRRVTTADVKTSHVEAEQQKDEQPEAASLQARATRTVASAFRKKPEPPSPLQEATQALEQHDYASAEDILVPYIVEHTKDTGAYMMLGRAALGQEHWKEAEEIFSQVIEWNPDEEGVYVGLGSAALHAGHLSQALTALQRAHEADPLNRDVLEQLLSIAQRMDNKPLQDSIQQKLEELTTAEPASSS